MLCVFTRHNQDTSIGILRTPHIYCNEEKALNKTPFERVEFHIIVMTKLYFALPTLTHSLSFLGRNGLSQERMILSCLSKLIGWKLNDEARREKPAKTDAKSKKGNLSIVCPQLGSLAPFSSSSNPRTKDSVTRAFV